MKIDIVGGGPAGLFFAILMKRSDPAADITVLERNQPDDTFGFGIVFSDETLANLEAADPETLGEVIENFAYWTDIETFYKGEVLRSGGHGFCGISRKVMLNILQRRARQLGIRQEFQTEVPAPTLPGKADLVVACDGGNSTIREHFKGQFRPQIRFRPNKFVWLGSDLPLPAFTFMFRETAHGIWNVHSYQYMKGGSTFIVETTEACWRAAGFDQASEVDTARELERMFAAELRGHRLITNRSLWRNFPVIKCGAWSHGNVVLIGDAAHTAHFSIGSGTKLAMEDAIALHEAMVGHRGDVRAALAAYEAARRPEVERIQHAAETSMAWFENVRRFWHMEPVQFNFSLMSRSKQITYDNLRHRDPAFGAEVTRWFAGSVERTLGFEAPDPSPPPMFTPFRLRGMTVSNRVVVSPMCQYSAKDGLPDDWHMVHLGSRALGGAGLVVTEMTCVARDGRISPGCTGMYKPAHQRAWKRIVEFVHARSAAKFCLQLGHAGRKGSTQLGWEEMDRPLKRGNWKVISASAIPYYPDGQVPRAMDRADMDRVKAEFVRAAEMGVACGFDMLELHMAHGYLLASFISPLTNLRTDAYGGDLAGRMRFPLEVFDAVRAVWPVAKPMSVRLSATDWVEDGGLTGDDAVEIARMFKAHGCDAIDVSTGQTTPDAKPLYGRMYQTPFSEQIRNEVGIATIAVGAITSADQVNTIVASGRADLCALARPHLADPYFTLHAAAEYGVADIAWPDQYLSAKTQLDALAARRRAESPAPRRAELIRRMGRAAQ